MRRIKISNFWNLLTNIKVTFVWTKSIHVQNVLFLSLRILQRNHKMGTWTPAMCSLSIVHTHALMRYATFNHYISTTKMHIISNLQMSFISQITRCIIICWQCVLDSLNIRINESVIPDRNLISCCFGYFENWGRNNKIIGNWYDVTGLKCSIGIELVGD